jgi:hypothetical protein
MLSENDRQGLFRNLARNRVILVTGAGFSADATNVLGQNMPVGDQLACALWHFLYDSGHDGRTSLKTLYAAAQTNVKGKAALRQFLQSHLTVQSYPEWYKIVPRYHWSRIYTFNADDLLERLYEQVGAPRLQTIVAPADYSDRDAFLRSAQYIKLHGSADDPRDLTFGPREFGARAAARVDIWYLHFIEDYSTLPTIFVGTELDEPIFAQYVELRGAQPRRGDRIRRPKCFLISPNVSKPNEEVLDQYNILPIRVTASDFFTWLIEEMPPPTRENVLRLVDPTLEPALLASEKGSPARAVQLIEYFYTLFRIPVRSINPRSRGMFLLGAPPSWDEISADVDAHREIDDVLLNAAMQLFREPIPNILLLIAAAGGGKSTIAKRVALELVDRGYTVFFSEGETRPDPDKLADHLLSLSEKSFLFFDNAGQDFGLIADLWNRLKDNAIKPVIVVIARSNDVAFRGYELGRSGAAITEIEVPHLSDSDIDAIIETLDRHDLLGILKDKPHEERVALFKTKARKQILVAMREVTSGLGFNQIIRGEFEAVQPESAKLLYLTAAIASDGSYGLTKQQMITAMDLQPRETLVLIEKSLAGILIQSELDETKYFIRHPAIAHFVLAAAPREMLAEATVSLLIALSTVLPSGRERRWSRAFRLYRDVLNHRRIHSMFVGRIDLGRQVYEVIKDCYRDDGHYWLQYASYEIEYGGDMSLAENFLGQASGLLPENRQVETATAHLLFKKALAAQEENIACGYKDEGLEILRRHMADRASVSLHALHIFRTQMMAYIWKWGVDNERAEHFRAAHQELRTAIPDQMRSHLELRRVLDQIKRAELETVVAGG